MMWRLGLSSVSSGEVRRASGEARPDSENAPSSRGVTVTASVEKSILRCFLSTGSIGRRFDTALDARAAPVASAFSVTVSYTGPKSAAELWDSAGNQIADFSGVVAAAPETSAVTGVEVVSDAGGEATYVLGEAVEVTGAPGLKIDMDPAGWWGEYRAGYKSGLGTAVLSFAHTVV